METASTSSGAVNRQMLVDIKRSSLRVGMLACITWYHIGQVGSSAPYFHADINRTNWPFPYMGRFVQGTVVTIVNVKMWKHCFLCSTPAGIVFIDELRLERVQ